MRWESVWREKGNGFVGEVDLVPHFRILKSVEVRAAKACAVTAVHFVSKRRSRMRYIRSAVQQRVEVRVMRNTST